MFEKFNYKTIIIARESRGLTQQELAEKINYSQSALSKIENGNQSIDEELINILSKKLNYPESFFSQEMEIYPPNLHYRKKADVTSKVLAFIEAQMNIYRVSIQRLLSSIQIPSSKLPFINQITNITPQDAAKYLRQFWGLPKGAIENVADLLEDNGILIIPMDFGTERIDGRSMVTSDGKFIIYINKNISGDRQRYTLCHELAHIILHINSINIFEVDIEKEAMVFASEFLMPEFEIRPQLIGKLTIQKLADLKRYWKVSMQAILYWATSLKTVTANQARYLWTQFNSLRIKVKEPIDIPYEQPSLLKEVIRGFIEQLAYTKDELAAMLHLSMDDFKNLFLTNEAYLLKVIR